MPNIVFLRVSNFVNKTQLGAAKPHINSTSLVIQRMLRSRLINFQLLPSLRKQKQNVKKLAPYTYTNYTILAYTYSMPYQSRNTIRMLFIIYTHITDVDQSRSPYRSSIKSSITRKLINLSPWYLMASSRSRSDTIQIKRKPIGPNIRQPNNIAMSDQTIQRKSAPKSVRSRILWWCEQTHRNGRLLRLLSHKTDREKNCDWIEQRTKSELGLL